ncbi:hypothetical protein BDN72DRAFT_856529 [Pluteus cervinus]|uniref:Uncharacterized protein n=1 Tax=Pluteus cervinus TaxID=181527 RepID=A0ACD3AZJ3_9AGAR|nr:hypothetical protein BDN72DRAFT_856529 [Pluteus cervinus]
MSKDVLEQARKDIDAEIMVLQERITILRSSRNALVPIYRLPPELMVRIFRWLQRSYIYNGETLVSLGANKSVLLPRWMRVTCVSQRWRNIARSSATLHSTIPTGNLRYAEEMLKRSGSAALTLVDDESASSWKNLARLQELVIPVLPRFQALWLDSYIGNFILPRLESSTPNLKELYIQNCTSVGTTPLPYSLRTLRSDFCAFKSFEWLSDLSNLVHLALINPFGYTGERVALGVLLKAVDGMPRLISLELTSTLKSPQVNQMSPIRPKLQYLRVIDTFHILSQLLPWVEFADRFTVDIRCESTSNPQPAADWAPVINLLDRRLKASSMVLRLAHFSWQDEDGSSSASIQCSRTVGEAPCFLLRVPLKRGEARIWSKYASAFPLDQVETLITDGIWDSADWRDSPWSDSRSIRRLTLSDKWTSSAYLQHLANTRGHPSTGCMIFPSLEELSLHGLHYSRDLQSKVQALLTERMKRGVKLRRLVFGACSVSEDFVQQLLAIVDVVEQHGGTKAKKGSCNA